MDEQPLTESLRCKITDAIDRTDHLTRLVPTGHLDWHPAAHPGNTIRIFRVGELLGHLVDCLAGFCAALSAAFPSELADFSNLRQIGGPVRSPQDASERMAKLSACIERGFGICTDSALARKIPTIFAPEGEELLTILLGNFEHLTSHKQQLFLYLKLLGVPVGTADLYRLRGSLPDRKSTN
jgi:hypothetical protein